MTELTGEITQLPVTAPWSKDQQTYVNGEIIRGMGSDSWATYIRNNHSWAETNPSGDLVLNERGQKMLTALQQLQDSSILQDAVRTHARLQQEKPGQEGWDFVQTHLEQWIWIAQSELVGQMIEDARDLQMVTGEKAENLDRSFTGENTLKGTVRLIGSLLGDAVTMNTENAKRLIDQSDHPVFPVLAKRIGTDVETIKTDLHVNTFAGIDRV